MKTDGKSLTTISVKTVAIDDNVRFFQMIESISKVAEKGKHSFMIGYLNQIVQIKK